MTDFTTSVRRLFFADQETVTVWVPTATNQAGSFDLGTNGSLMCGAQTSGPSLLWTTVDLWRMTYLGQPFVFSFQQVGANCGIISKHAFAVVDASAFWMGAANFYLYDGFVKPIPCEVQDYVFGDLSSDYAYKIWGLNNAAYGEVTWFYPSSASTSCDRYVTFNYRENHWTVGTLGRAAGVSSAAPGTVPVMIDESGNVYDHETGTDFNNEGTASLESGPVEIGSGDRLMLITGFVPDDKTVGDVNVTLYGANYPDDAETTYGPFTLTSWSTFIAKARQVRVKFTQVTATAWRIGTVRLSGRLGSKR